MSFKKLIDIVYHIYKRFTIVSAKKIMYLLFAFICHFNNDMY